MIELKRQDLVDILHGAAILGAGGGGEISEGLELIDEALAAGKPFRLLTLDEVPDEALICTPYLLGAISELPPEEEADYARLMRSTENPLLTAYARFQRYLGEEFYATVPCELGGSNTAAAFFPAVMNGHFILDADPAGRAVPEITHSTYFLNDLPAAPIVGANEFGECMILEGIADDQRAEMVVRALSQVSRNTIAAIDHALPMSQLRDVLIPGTVSRALMLGRAWREAKRENPAGVVDKLAAIGGGKLLFTGRVSECSHETREGFTFGEIQIEGDGPDVGSAFRITLKNENMAGWKNGTIAVTIPDIITLFDLETGDVVLNPHYRLDQRVAVVAFPAPEPFTTPRGLEVFGPGYIGLESTVHRGGLTRSVLGKAYNALARITSKSTRR